MDASHHAPHPDAIDLDGALQRARADSLAMPGLHLTPDQARRLWMLDGSTCAMVLSSLVASGFLSRSKTAHSWRASARHGLAPGTRTEV